ncbi:MAG TPA: 1,2-phenylacetyl-CoA epoxidase subunit PaaC [Xanthomonadales bacterium]|nr:1,2-phenylacetyl-CoA epoxidase subunit PaaC [Xanthomonadales bacterium]
MNNPADNTALVHYAIGLADDALTLGHRLSEWCSNGPFLEEDLAQANVALDFIGRARMLYTYAAGIEGRGRGEDDIAYRRDCREYTNLLINELPRGDFADTMARQLLVDAFDVEFFTALTVSADQTLAAIAAKAIKESRYHLRRSRDWVIRLGDGSEESHQRMQRGFDRIWGYSHELFAMNAAEQGLADAGIAVDRSSLRSAWDKIVDAVLAEATLARPAGDWAVQGGRDGIHTEHLGYLLAELQFMQRAYPGLQW